MDEREPRSSSHSSLANLLAVSVATALCVAVFGVIGLGTLDLSEPQYGGCGLVTINGYVNTDPPAESLTWDWGDGRVTQSWFPATHRYLASGTYTVTVTAPPSSESNSTTVTPTGAGDPTCSYRVNVTPPWVLLRDGRTTQMLTVEIRDAEGNVLPNAGFSLHFGSDNPSVVSVNSRGIVSSAGFGRAWITVSADGVSSYGTARVVAGRFWIEPAILYLSPGGAGSTASVTAFAENADGSPVSSPAIFVGGSPVASVGTMNGLVTALVPPSTFYDSPYLSGSLGGQPTDNATFVRVTADDLGLTPMRYAGENIELWTPSAVCACPFAQLVTDLRAVDVLDRIYALEQWLTDVTPSDGETQRLVLDPGIDADGTVPCGLAGNPLRFGTGVDNCRSCFGGEDWLHWGIMAHEMGHNFMAQRAFEEFCGLLKDGGGTYSEGMATMLGIYAIDEMVDHSGTYGLPSNAVENLSRGWIPLTPNHARTIFYAELEEYESSPDYANLTADHLDAILTQLHDEFGESFFYRLLSAFFPPHSGMPIPMSTEAEALSFWAAACSAAAGTDLLDRFATQWAFPLDEAFYHQILPRVRALTSQREHMSPRPAAFQLERGGVVQADGAYYASHYYAGAADIAEWVQVSEPCELGVVLELDAAHPASYRPSQQSCSVLVAGAVSSGPGIVLGGIEPAKGRALLALSGIVPVKVTNEGGPIQPGDLLVSSSTPGYAMRWAGSEPCPCALVGKALDPMTDSRGVISVLLTAH